MLAVMAGYVLLVGGPAGAGKTTAAHAWASVQDEPTANGFNCVIDDGMFAGRVLARYELWAQLLGGIRHHLVILLPSLATCLERNAERSGLKRLDEDLIRRFHARSAEWTGAGVPVIDTSSMSVGDTVAAITRTLELQQSQPAS